MLMAMEMMLVRQDWQFSAPWDSPILLSALSIKTKELGDSVSLSYPAQSILVRIY